MVNVIDIKQVHRQEGPLEFVSEVELDGFSGKFYPSAGFCYGKSIGGIPIGNMDDEFMHRFLLGKLEKPIKHTGTIPTMRVPFWDLTRETRDIDIFSTWLGPEGMVLDVARVFQIMSLGRKGPSLTNNMLNVAFVRPSPKGVPQAIHWNTYMGTWHISLMLGSVEDLGLIKNRRKLPKDARIFGGLSPSAEENQPLAF
jgi:hypothetical protein